MSENFKTIQAELHKSKAEFDIAITCIIQAIQSLHERLDRVESWISDQKNRQLS